MKYRRHSLAHSPRNRKKAFAAARRIDAARPSTSESRILTEMGPTPRQDVETVLDFYHLSKTFPDDVRAEADALSQAGVGEATGRLDLRKTFIFTCDPVTAKDYDDALSLEIDRQGFRRVGVHIADVSHYVKEGSAIDREAYRRAMSVYLTDCVVPMLPEVLSNGVCSLVPGEDRLTFSVFMTFDAQGEMVKREFARTVICSSARYTYEEVMGVIVAGEKGVRAAKRKTGPLGAKARETLLELSALAQQLRARRFSAGALDLEVPEAEVLLDEAGELAGITTRTNDASHQLVEEFMVAANEAVAKELWTKGIRILARLHEPPEQEKIEILRADLASLNIKVGNLVQPKAMTRFLHQIRENPLYPTLAVMVLRSMKRAVYDAGSIGHFGLAKSYYAHFTSPIRRYPDLTLHRQLAHYLAHEPCRVPPRTLEKWGAHVTAMEELSAEAERALVEMKKYRLLEGELVSRERVVYDAVISKCMPFGCFVEIPAIAASGLVHVSTLSRRYVNFDDAQHVLSTSDGATWRVGDKLKVRVTNVDFRQRRLDFEPVRDHEGR